MGGNGANSLVLATRDDDVAIFELGSGVTHAIGLQLVEDLSRALASARDDPDVRSVVVTGRGDRFFSIGFDLPSLLPLDRDGIRRFMTAFNRMSLDLFAFPKPTVAAIRGHAVAGGCVLAICCRRRVIAEGRTFLGLNEVKLGVPVPRPARCILRSIVGAHAARKMIEEGDFFEPQAALLLGLVDGIATPERVVADAVAKARKLAAMADPEVDVDPRRFEAVLAQVADGAAEDAERFLDAWFSDETQRLLAEACELF